MASVIGGGLRKVPRIMSRKSIKKVKDAPTNNGRDTEDDKLKNQGFEVHSGVLTINPSHPAQYKQKSLPGLANEVESYPCRFCTDRVFLTGAWLEKHAKEAHPTHLSEILTDIMAISTEWKKREFDQIRAKERQTIDRIRHEARANELIRQAMNGGVQEITGDRYEACGICNVLINIAHPTAMESHQRAHKKNDELRMQLIDQYGSEIVQRLTCDSCSLVFTEERKLQSHVSTHHVRKKRYICKFCGHISQSMTELNLHKSDVHNIILPHRAQPGSDNWNVGPEFLRSRRQFSRFDDPLKKRARKRAAVELRNSTTSQAVIGHVSEGDTPCKVHCPSCGLKLNRPLLLIKHMDRVHSTKHFSCVVESGGLPSFGIKVDETGISYTCCRQNYENRPDFIEHRRLHIPSMSHLHDDVGGGGEEEESTTADEIATSSMIVEEDHEEGEEEEEGEDQSNYEGQLVQGPDGSMQVILPEGMEVNGEVYVMFDEEYDGDKSNAKVRLVQTTSQGIEEQQILDEDENGGQQILQRDVITLTQEQYEELQLNGWNNMNIMMINGGEVIEDDGHHQNVVEEVVIGDDEENHQNEENEIHGTPLFD